MSFSYNRKLMGGQNESQYHFSPTQPISSMFSPENIPRILEPVLKASEADYDSTSTPNFGSKEMKATELATQFLDDRVEEEEEEEEEEENYVEEDPHNYIHNEKKIYNPVNEYYESYIAPNGVSYEQYMDDLNHIMCKCPFEEECLCHGHLMLVEMCKKGDLDNHQCCEMVSEKNSSKTSQCPNLFYGNCLLMATKYGLDPKQPMPCRDCNPNFVKPPKNSNKRMNVDLLEDGNIIDNEDEEGWLEANNDNVVPDDVIGAIKLDKKWNEPCEFSLMIKLANAANLSIKKGLKTSWSNEQAN